MAHIKISAKRNINSLIRKILYWKMPIGTKIVGVFKKPLSITCWKKEKDQILAKSGPTIKKRGGLQD
jgi:hypothetical protein